MVCNHSFTEKTHNIMSANYGGESICEKCYINFFNIPLTQLKEQKYMKCYKCEYRMYKPITGLFLTDKNMTKCEYFHVNCFKDMCVHDSFHLIMKCLQVPF